MIEGPDREGRSLTKALVEARDRPGVGPHRGSYASGEDGLDQSEVGFPGQMSQICMQLNKIVTKPTRE
jgi:hypothetical protein